MCCYVFDTFGKMPPKKTTQQTLVNICIKCTHIVFSIQWTKIKASRSQCSCVWTCGLAYLHMKRSSTPLQRERSVYMQRWLVKGKLTVHIICVISCLWSLYKISLDNTIMVPLCFPMLVWEPGSGIWEVGYDRSC